MNHNKNFIQYPSDHLPSFLPFLAPRPAPAYRQAGSVGTGGLRLTGMGVKGMSASGTKAFVQSIEFSIWVLSWENTDPGAPPFWARFFTS
jgi:hypothetical protein